MAKKKKKKNNCRACKYQDVVLTELEMNELSFAEQQIGEFYLFMSSHWLKKFCCQPLDRKWIEGGQSIVDDVEFVY